jgi:hypothetical protein
MSRHPLNAQSTGRRTLGPFTYVMPIMPPILMGGPFLIAIPIQNIFSFIAALILGIGLGILWMCMMRIAQRLDEATVETVEAPSGESASPVGGG